MGLGRTWWQEHAGRGGLLRTHRRHSSRKGLETNITQSHDSSDPLPLARFHLMTFSHLPKPAPSAGDKHSVTRSCQDHFILKWSLDVDGGRVYLNRVKAILARTGLSKITTRKCKSWGLDERRVKFSQIQCWLEGEIGCSDTDTVLEHIAKACSEGWSTTLTLRLTGSYGCAKPCGMILCSRPWSLPYSSRTLFVTCLVNHNSEKESV